MEKLKNIEFLRVFLICSVVFLHMFIDRQWCLCTLFPDISIYQTLKAAIGHSNNCVEGFFIVAGFLLIYTFKPNISIKNFILKKYIRLSPVILFSMVLCFIGFLLGTMKFDWVSNILTVLLVNQFGIKIVCGQNPILWYTSVLFAGLLLYFCIIKYLPLKLRNILIFTLIISSYTILELLQHGSFANPLKNYHHVLNVGFLRALGGIGLGCIIGGIYNYYLSKIDKIKENIISKIFFSVSEILLLVFIFWWCLVIHKGLNNIYFVLSFSVLLLLFIIKRGYISQFLNKNVWAFLGKFQYSIYVIHYVIIRIFGLALWNKNPDFVLSHPILPIVIMILTILFAGVITYYMIELPCANFLKNKLLGKKN